MLLPLLSAIFRTSEYLEAAALLQVLWNVIDASQCLAAANVAGPNRYVVLHDGCIYLYKNERAKTAKEACSLYGYLQ